MAVLLGVAHGTRDPSGAATVRALLALVRAARPELAVAEAYAENARPSVAAAVGALAPGPLVAVPLLLGRGFHVHVDIPAQLTGAGAHAVVSRPLGPHAELTRALVDRLGEGARADAVVLGAAGSTDPRGVADVRTAARMLGRRLGREVPFGFVGGPGPRLDDVVAAARAGGARNVAVASYLLAPGFFQGRLVATGADLVGPPLGAHPAIASLILRRYDEALIASQALTPR
ncbi:sirohydrochlorin chelatase [Actinocorallia sp. A-T 12471]|uniref:sirohydrochlorin chelatase n=1 Tax=Actinocorallia sp. A-T 12471 TaxID=3089813 RepID=UPI0029D25E48|nr:sirohydrochlorin chelatase [Actinocorallia sp. A-T 12471]MDX6739956.1 sirohydrochlorin chelatase [Actinocorallia sp. A-T 12471]